MQNIVLLAVAFSFLGIALAKPIEKEQHPFIRSANECKAELGITDATDTIQSFNKKGRLVLCLNVKLGLMDPNGNINVDEFKKTILEIVKSQSKTDEIVARCGKRTNNNAEEAAVELFACIHKDAKQGDQHPFDKTVNECKAEIGLKDTSGSNTLESIENNGPLALCLNVKLGIMDSNGNINADALRKLILRMKVPEAKAEEIVTRCSKGTSEKHEDTAVELLKCIHKDVKRT